MKGSKVIEFVLDLLQGGTEAAIALTDVMTSDYVQSRKKAWRYMNSRDFEKRWSDLYRDKQKFHALLNYLKTQGFVESEKKNKKSFWRITKRGREKFSLLRERNLYGRESTKYPSNSDDTVKIISYDIPVMENKKRHWLRWSLLALGFTMLQRSVWIGKKKIPEEFLRDIRERRMLSYLHIFEVKKSGTLKELI